MAYAFSDRPFRGDRVSRVEVLALRHRLQGLSTQALLERAIRHEFPGDIAVVTAFGAESVVLLDAVAQVSRDVPVIFLDTGKHFADTLGYRDRLIAELGLRDVRVISPDAAMLSLHDPDGTLWQRDPDLCCAIRKVDPLSRALVGFSAWLNGRKGGQGGSRAGLPRLEHVDGRVKLNPLADWDTEAVERAFETRNLPRHPLVAEGYLSIGCAPCTEPVAPGADPRSGRWRGRDKDECGIHGGLAADEGESHG